MIIVCPEKYKTLRSDRLQILTEWQKPLARVTTV